MGPVIRITGPSQTIEHLLCNHARKNFVVEESYYTTKVCLVLYLNIFCERASAKI